MATPTLDISLVVIGGGDRPKPALFVEMMEVYRKELDLLGRSYEVVVVDDGAGESFANAALSVREKWPAVRVIRFRRTFGESVALDTAVEHARGRYVIASTWYLQVDPAGIREAIRILDSGQHFVAARRAPRVDGKLARFQSWLFNSYTRSLTGVPLHDLNCSFRAFRREVVEELHFHGDLFRFIGILAIQKGFRVQELPLRHLREEGSGGVFHPGMYIRRFLDILSIFFLIKFTHKPLRFFGLVGFFFILVGSVISAWMLYKRLFGREGLTERPLVIAGIFLVVLGFIVGSIGLIGEIIIFTQGRALRDFHIDRIVEGDDPPEKGP